MRILTLFLALFLTLLPESVSYVPTTSYGQEVCFEDASDVEEEAVLRAPQRVSEKVQTLSETVFADCKSGFAPVFHVRSLHVSFERLWLTACTLRL
ncbi:MAG: hypothetical protein IJ773_06985 [Lachnospiraceae bacterium]|nr:hypothetical protein [Lachnospiraceae bacterium]